MSGLDKLKDNKKLIIIAAGAVAIIVALIVFVLPNFMQKGEEPQPEVVSKRVKIDLKPQATPAAPQSAAVAAAPAPAVKPGETKPAPAAKPGETKPAIKTAPAQVAKAEPEKKPAIQTEIAKSVKAPKKVSKARISSKPWAVNLSSFITNNEAQSFRKRLRASGYKAYVSKFEKDGMTWHRVRVGFYRTQAEAKAAGKKIADKFKIDHEPWILKPAKSEMAKYAK